MSLVCFSASHQHLDIDVLAQLSALASPLQPGPLAVSGRRETVVIAGVVPLLTCNRYELYVDIAPMTQAASESAGASMWRDAVPQDLASPSYDLRQSLKGQDDREVASDLSQELVGLLATELHAACGLDTEVLRRAFQVTLGEAAVSHLFAVASGLESMIVGEREVNGQVRRALRSAQQAKSTSMLLEHVFQQAPRISRRVEAATGLGGLGRSVVDAGLDLARPRLPRWPQARTLLIGTGSYAGACVAALRTRGCTDVQIHSVSGRGEQFARRRGLVAVGADGLIAAVSDADLVIACSGRIGGVLDTVTVAAARQRAQQEADRGQGVRGAGPRPLVILDLALARDVERRAADIDGVQLLDLATIQQQAPSLADSRVVDARRIVAAAVAEMARWERERAVATEVARMRHRSNAAVGAELDRLGQAADERAVRLRHAQELHRSIMRVKRTVATR